ncbi:MAG: DUF3427 domain-containing protein [Cyclobacteriaceae bacterium]|nr:DUF3427 domain-containing protein [Cyclobacteriaceae bacterium]MDH4297960.1 DUF3427 domain-containing protein [Cyclobacteriaceae bacterium]MDH5250944.1 DUF3427 domain-containing protein [Cyclobacteriaceae bacterium]
MNLERWKFYSREELHKIFEKEKPYKSGSGKWGLTGIISVPDKKGDFIFFVTLGTVISHHEFKESITQSGILTWQSQPDQALHHPQIKQLINHDEKENQIHLLLRTNSTQESYLYFGLLKYLEHNNEQERPVHFKWQILDWEIKPDLFKQVNLELTEEDDSVIELIETSDDVTVSLIREDPPTPQNRAGVSRKVFARIVKPDYALREEMNRKLGKLGEESVLSYEKERLVSRPDLADKVRHISEEEGDGAGYDIQSFELNGQIRYIEVKTTTGGKDNEFYATSSELEFAKRNNDSYYLYRVFEYDKKEKSGKFFVVKGIDEDIFQIEPHQFKLKPR